MPISKAKADRLKSKGAKFTLNKVEHKPIKDVEQKPASKPDHSVHMAKAQMQATLALTEIAAKAIQNPQMEEVIRLLSEPKQDVVRVNKKLTIKRDSNGLIESIEVEEI